MHVLRWFKGGFAWFLALQHLVLRNDSESFTSWANPPTTPYMKIHIFNYTNIEDFKTGKDKKLKVKDLGPYTFE